MEKVRVDTDKCKGCYLCMDACKFGAIDYADGPNIRGIIPIQVDQDKCKQCGSCYAMCPDLVFEIL